MSCYGMSWVEHILLSDAKGLDTSSKKLRESLYAMACYVMKFEPKMSSHIVMLCYATVFVVKRLTWTDCKRLHVIEKFGSKS